MTPSAQTGAPQGLAVDRRHAKIPTELYYRGYVGQCISSVEGFQNVDCVLAVPKAQVAEGVVRGGTAIEVLAAANDAVPSL